MNRGELAGKFSNGKSVVANNQQITTGIKMAVMEGMSPSRYRMFGHSHKPSSAIK